MQVNKYYEKNKGKFPFYLNILNKISIFARVNSL